MSYELDHATTTGGEAVEGGNDCADFSCRLETDKEYAALEKGDIRGRIGDTELPSSDYTFTDGELTIPQNLITGDITINVTARLVVASVETGQEDPVLYTDLDDAFKALYYRKNNRNFL